MNINEKPKKILVADDDPDTLKILTKTFKVFGYEVCTAENGKSAVESAVFNMPDMILIDINMPEMDGYEACSILKNDFRTKEIPVIFISGLNEPINTVKAFEHGAVDYLIKPVHIMEASARVKVHLDLRQKMKELEQFNKIMINREMRIVELKQEVNQLAADSGNTPPYPEIWNQQYQA